MPGIKKSEAGDASDGLGELVFSQTKNSWGATAWDGSEYGFETFVHARLIGRAIVLVGRATVAGDLLIFFDQPKSIRAVGFVGDEVEIFWRQIDNPIFAARSTEMMICSDSLEFMRSADEPASASSGVAYENRHGHV